MRLLLFISFIFVGFVAVTSATAIGPNAERLKRGLPPLSPRRPFEASAVTPAKRSSPSGLPYLCELGPLQCCETYTDTSDPVAQLILGLLGITVGLVEPCGLNCVAYLPTCKFEVLCCLDYSYV
ncbi:hypothetical protein PUNSTDRAFT_132212 [Punctularia strigosozonata HHB-11173 SS5]|uniref:uncharacterized protein n=1 Tax=Punctularia strigosozonata (strain HHB-11173) TaxID=741275 RepID=UPI0004416DFB|nr:uncharacterized protein PUNSTDRAFT_132212 [Punctularia strigosozonata HHB-11173 SS5]EIN12081.1 hypothetical protein PUNSTDRAFT_132212 [Punctularia strigosozonata HHB-11173 SS5]